MPSDERDPLLELLRDVPARGPASDVDDRTLARGRIAYERRRSSSGAWGGLAHAAASFAVPALLAGTAAVYLTCAIRAANALFR
jgi:hypothetical protein